MPGLKEYTGILNQISIHYVFSIDRIVFYISLHCGGKWQQNPVNFLNVVSNN